MACDLCGKNAELFKAIVEDVELTVCKNCSSFGTTVKKLIPDDIRRTPRVPSPAQVKPQDIEHITEDCAQRLKSAREKLGMTQADFAKYINEKLSVVHNLENGAVKPTLQLARALEKKLHIKLIQKEIMDMEEHLTPSEKKGMDTFTLGDFIKLKK